MGDDHSWSLLLALFFEFAPASPDRSPVASRRSRSSRKSGNAKAKAITSDKTP